MSDDEAGIPSALAEGNFNLINYQVIVTRFRPDVALFQKTKWEKYNEKIWNEVIMMYY